MPTLHQYRKENRQELGYQLFLPANYEELYEKKWPLILFLHGSGRRGTDIRILDGYGLNGIAENNEDFEFIVLTPQCPSSEVWANQHGSLLYLLDKIISKYRVDTDRIYLTGFSMGGIGSWSLAAHAPQRFAAVAPIAGWFEPEMAHSLMNVPIWNFHGQEDETVPFHRSEKIVSRLIEIGGNVRFTRYPNAGHGVMNETYRNPDLYKWFLEHTKKVTL